MTSDLSHRDRFCTFRDEVGKAIPSYALSFGSGRFASYAAASTTFLVLQQIPPAEKKARP